MNRTVLAALSCTALIAVAACEPATVRSETTASVTPSDGPTLADVLVAVETPPEMTEVSSIDPAAQNIDPFRSVYKSEQIEGFTQAADREAGTEGALDSNLVEARAVLSVEAPMFDTDIYEEGLRCAATIDAASRLGAMPAHTAQADARAVLAASATGVEGQMRPDADENEREIFLRDFREKTYVSYRLIRDDLVANSDVETLAADADSCAVNFGVGQPEQEEPESEEPQS